MSSPGAILLPVLIGLVFSSCVQVCSARAASLVVVDQVGNGDDDDMTADGAPGRLPRATTMMESQSISLPRGSIPPQRGGGVIRKPPRGTQGITLVGLAPRPLEPVVSRPQATPEATVERLPDEEETYLMPRSSLAGSSPHSSKPRAPKITECRRKRKMRTLSMDGCRSVSVDVGYCQGACRSREYPGNSLTLSGDAFIFEIKGKCRTCRAEFETTHLRMLCSTSPHSAGNNIPQDLGEHTASVAIKVVRSCSCMKCYV